ncbi:response regulator [Streptomyces sp. URMC 129]|uniref:response regulator n=1 Tax=Streptomyces sp. URMC 129 TaxID=3423407 RepID=UPI003F1D9334
MIRVLIVDDEPLARSALQTLLGTDAGLRVVGQSSGRDAVPLARTTRPDVVLLDIRMPDADGITVLRGLRALPAPPAVLMMTSIATDDDVLRAFAAGACGYLLKDASVEELTSAVRKARAGVGVVSDHVAPAVIAGYRAHAARSAGSQAARHLAEALTARERDVLRLLGGGLSNREIAERLIVSPETIKTHLTGVFAKLGTSNRVRAALIAERIGLLEDRP